MSTKVLTDLDLDNNDLLNVGSGGGGGVATEDEGISVDPAATTLNFVGAGVTATDAGSNVTTVTIPGGGGASPLTTKGDLYTYDTGDQRLPVGTDGQILSANSATSTGLEWIANTGGGGGGIITVPNAVIGTFTLAPAITVPANNSSFVQITGLPFVSETVTGMTDNSGGTTDAITVPVGEDGTYKVNWHIKPDGAASAYTVGVSIRVNGVQEFFHPDQSFITGQDKFLQGTTFNLDLVAGDEVTIFVRQNDTVTRDITNAFLWVTKVNPLTGGGGSGGGYAENIGNGAATSFVVTHNLGTKDIVAQVWETASPFDQVLPLISATSDNTITVDFDATVPTTGQYRVFVTSGGGGGSGQGFDTKLTANTTVNVNNFTELLNEIDNVIPGIFLNGFDYTVQCANGTYTFTQQVDYKAPVGAGSVIFQGDNGNITNVDWAMANNVFVNQSGNTTNDCIIRDLQFSGNTTVQTIQCSVSSVVELDNVKFATGGSNNLINISRGGIVLLRNGADISGITVARFCNNANGLIQALGSQSIDVTGSTWTSQFVRAADLGYIRLDSGSVSYTGSATGIRYQVEFNSVIQTGSGGSPTTLPGDTNGSATTGGQYN